MIKFHHKKIFGPPGQFLLSFLQVFDISRGKTLSRSEVGRSKGGKVGRLDVGKIGRFEGGKARKNLMEAYTFHNSFLIPSTQKFFIGDLRSPIFHKIYSPVRNLQIAIIHLIYLFCIVLKLKVDLSSYLPT